MTRNVLYSFIFNRYITALSLFNEISRLQYILLEHFELIWLFMFFMLSVYGLRFLAFYKLSPPLFCFWIRQQLRGVQCAGRSQRRSAPVCTATVRVRGCRDRRPASLAQDGPAKLY
jgi:hypothetical protein